MTIDGRRQTAVGVVLGQWENNNTSVVLAAAGEAAEQLVNSVVAASGMPTTATPGVAGDRGQKGDSQGSLPQLPTRRPPAGDQNQPLDPAAHIVRVSKNPYVLATSRWLH